MVALYSQFVQGNGTNPFNFVAHEFCQNDGLQLEEENEVLTGASESDDTPELTPSDESDVERRPKRKAPYKAAVHYKRHVRTPTPGSSELVKPLRIPKYQD